MNFHSYTQRLFTIRCTLRKMLHRRGYTIPFELDGETQESFDALYNNASTSLATSDADVDLLRLLSFSVCKDGQQLMVFFPTLTIKTSLGIAPIRLYVTSMQSQNCTQAILILSAGLTAPAVSMLRELELQGKSITAFIENEVLIDIYEHEKVPLHVPLSVAEKTELLRTMRITDKQLPEMQKQDPMARYLGLRVGDVVRIHRVSATVGHDIYYRIVVNSEDFA